MEIILAKNHGFCYGVKRAVEMANEAANNDGKSYTLGPIIHNPQVVGRLEDKGVSPVQEVSDIFAVLPQRKIFHLTGKSSFPDHPLMPADMKQVHPAPE